MNNRFIVLGRELFTTTSWLTVAIIILVQVMIAGLLTLVFGHQGNQEYAIFIWSVFFMSGLISAGIYLSQRLGLWLAAGCTRREVAATFIGSAVVYALGFTGVTAVTVAAMAWRHTGSLWGWEPGARAANVLPFSALTVAVIFGTFLIGILGAGLAFTGFIRWHWIIALGWTAFTLVLPLGLLISGYVLALTQIAGVGPAVGGFWDSYGSWARWTGFAAILLAAAYLPQQLQKTPVPAPLAV